MNAILSLILNSAMFAASTVFASNAESTDHKVRSEMLVSTQWLAEHLKDPNIVVLCVSGSPGFYSEGHIPGAHWINLQDIVTKRGDVPNELPSVARLATVFRAAGVTARSRIVLYGDDYNLLAARAYFTMDYLGLAEHAALLDGGIDKWKNELKPMAKGESKGKTPVTALEPKVNRHVLVETADMRAITANGKHPALLDARPREEFAGERHSADVHKLGHIPGAKHLYWQDLLVSRENPVLLPPEELRKRFEAAGAAPGSEVITYCRSGMQSSFDYFVAKYLGYQARMYDASFFEWSMEDLPAEVSK